MNDTTEPAVLPVAGYRPGAGQVDVWVLSSDHQQEEAARKARHILDVTERERAAAFYRLEDRARYAVAHVGLRLLLGGYLGLRPQDVVLGRASCPLCGQAHGRPVVDATPALHFSLSHTRDLVVCAFASSPVGVDVEGASAAAAAELTSLLHLEEQVALQALPQGRRGAAFLRCWVRKEAYLKGIGVGLGVPLDSVNVGIGTESPGEYAESQTRGHGGRRPNTRAGDLDGTLISPTPPFSELSSASQANQGGEPHIPPPIAAASSGWTLAPVPVPEGYESAIALFVTSTARKQAIVPRVLPLDLAEVI